MSERLPDAHSPRQQLIALLASDFSPSETPPPPEPGNALADFLAHAVSSEQLDERYDSDEAVTLGRAAEAALASAPVTASFKSIIAHKLRDAYAWQHPVDLSPARLGLDRGEGIFDPAQVQVLETENLRTEIAAFFARNTLIEVLADGTEQPVRLGAIRPSKYVIDRQRHVDWLDDYRATYGEDPLFDPTTYLKDVPRVKRAPEGGSLNKLFAAVEAGKDLGPVRLPELDP